LPAIVDKKLCDACGTCMEECPTGAIEVGEFAIVDIDICTDCESCVEVCPNGAIKVD